MRLYEVILTDGINEERYIVRANVSFKAVPKAQMKATKLNRGTIFVKVNTVIAS